MGSEYYLAWLVYLLAVVSAHILLWRLTRLLSNKDIIIVIHLLVVSILLTPAALTEGQNYWVPAFMVALMEGLNEGAESALPYVWSILTVMLLLITASLGVKLYRRQRSAA